MEPIVVLKPNKITDPCFVTKSSVDGHSVISATIFDVVGDIENYTCLLQALNTASSEDVIDIKICSPGGQVDTGLRIMQAIQNCKGKVNTIGVGPCQSIAACIWAVGHTRVLVEPFGSLMIHMPSADISGKTLDIANDCSETNAFFAALIEKIFNGILTTDEFKECFNSRKDMYFDANTINSRLNLEGK